MKKLLAIVLALAPATALADQTLPNLINNAPALSQPYLATDYVPVTRGNTTYHVPALGNLGAGVTGPGSSTNQDFALWNGTTGTALSNGGGTNITHSGGLTNSGMLYGPDSSRTGTAALFGGRGQTPATTWLEGIISFSTSHTEVSALATAGFNGLTAATRLSDNATPANTFGIGLLGFVIADASNATQTGIALFSQSRASGIGTSQAAEFNPINISSANPQFQPYTYLSNLPATIGAWISSGDPSVTGIDNTVALGIVNNTNKFKSGIMIGANALTGGTGADGDTTVRAAIDLPRLAAINFWNSGNGTTQSAGIWSETTSATPRTQAMVFKNVGLDFQDIATGRFTLELQTSSTATCQMVFSQGVNAYSQLAQAMNGGTICTTFYNVSGAGGHVFQVAAANVLSMSGTLAQFIVPVQVASGSTLTLSTGQLGFSKITDPAAAVGAGGGAVFLVCGTNAGTAKLVAVAGTSATKVTIVDNIGAGVTGC